MGACCVRFVLFCGRSISCAGWTSLHRFDSTELTFVAVLFLQLQCSSTVVVLSAAAAMQQHNCTALMKQYTYITRLVRRLGTHRCSSTLLVTFVIAALGRCRHPVELHVTLLACVACVDFCVVARETSAASYEAA